MMYADRDYDVSTSDSTTELAVTVDDCVDKVYSVVNLRCLDRPKLLFDIVCTLTEM